ncbi:winged helix-turn-helix transcriptional regulator [Halovenus halobia]|uniref:winged helix-turn-helix transcriptional regulator n=1 Tax=Halovenus halobia TaxID=3396622 RepID=UPI003F5576BF
MAFRFLPWLLRFQRFGELLTEVALLERRPYDEIPPRVEYRPSDDGTALCALFDPVLE